MASQCTFRGCLKEGYHVPDVVFKGGRLSIDHVVLCDKHKETYGPDTLLDVFLKRPEIRKEIRKALRPYGLDIPKAENCTLEWITRPHVVGN